MTSLLAAITLSLGPILGPTKVDAEIFVRTEPQVSIEKLASEVRPIGRIEFRERGSRVFLISIRKGIVLQEAKRRLGSYVGIHPLDADEEPVDMNSVRSLDRKIAHLEEEENEEHEKDERDKADYFRAYRYFIGQRAFPNDRVNWNAISEAQRQAATLRTFRPKVNTQEASPSWSFTGPINLTVPYRQYFGLGPVTGRVNALAYDPNNSQTIYAGAAQGGIWKSLDGGSTWAWLSQSWNQLAVNCIVLDPTDSNTIYVGRGDYHGVIAGSFGIMKSSDGGVTWSEIAESTMGQIGVARILIDPTNHQTLIAGTGDANNLGNLYRSTDGGQTWSLLSVNGNSSTWPTLAASASNAGTTRFYAVAGGYANNNGSNSRIYKSDDHGATWQSLASPVIADGSFHWAYCIATSPTNPNNVYVLDSESEMLFTSSNQGASWQSRTTTLPIGPSNTNFTQSYYDYHLECGNRLVNFNNTDVLYLGEIDLTESIDGGMTWISIGGPSYEGGAIAHVDQHCLAINPTNPNNVIFGNDGGVYSLSFNPSTGKNTVTSLNKSLVATMFYKLACHPTNSSYLLGGTQDNASPFSRGDLTSWLNTGGGDGGGCAIDQTNPFNQYTSSENLTVYETQDEWISEKNISPTLIPGEHLPFVSPLVLNPLEPNLMYTGTNYLYRWDIGAQAWTNRLGAQDLTNQSTTLPVIQAIAIAPTDENRIYTGSSDGALWMSRNGGTSWTQLNAGANATWSASITSINVSPLNPNDILVGLSGEGLLSPHLFRCTNTLSPVPVIVGVSGSGSNRLPNASLNAVARDLDNPISAWWVATDVGVFQSTDSGTTWTSAGTPLGLPNVIVNDLVAVPGTRFLNAGTYGSGIWRLSLPSQSPVVAISNFTLSPSSIPLGQTSTGSITLSSPAPPGGFLISLASSSTFVATVPSSILVPAGSTNATFAVTLSPLLSSAGTSIISATANGVAFPQTLVVTGESLTSLTSSPSSVIGGNGSTGTVTLSAAAPIGGATVSLTSSNPSVVVPSFVTVPPGQVSTTFLINTSPVSISVTATVTATLGGVSQLVPLNVISPSLNGITLFPVTVTGGNSTTGTVSLNGLAGPNGTVVSLNSSSQYVVVPASVVVGPGQSTVAFPISTTLVSQAISSTITAREGGITQSAVLSLLAPTLQTISITPTSVLGGGAVSGFVSISPAAPSGGVNVYLSSNSLLATVPSSIWITGGATSATFSITTKPVGSITTVSLTAKLASASLSCSLSISPPALTSISVSPNSVVGGSQSSVFGTVMLNGPAPASGLVVKLTSSNPLIASTAPNVTIPAGSTSSTFPINTLAVTFSQTAMIHASSGGVIQNGLITVIPFTITSLVVSPTSVPGGTNASGTVSLNASPNSKITIGISSSSKQITFPTSVLVSVGASSVTFGIGTSVVSDVVSAQINANLGQSTQTTSLTITPPKLSGISVSPSKVQGSSSSKVTGTVSLTGPAPKGGVIISLDSSDTSEVKVPSTINVPAGKSSATFPVSHVKVKTQISVVISGAHSGVSLGTTLVVTP